MNLTRVLNIGQNFDKAFEVVRCIRYSRHWPRLIGGYLGIRDLEYPFEFITPHGDRIILENFHDLVTAWIIFFRDEYPVDPRCRTIVDAGANIGAFSLHAARVAPESRIIALEPFPETMTRLRSHVSQNHLEDRITCLPWALSRSDGRRAMPNDNGPSQSRGLLPEVDGVPGDGKNIEVETVTLESLFSRSNLDSVDLLKIDVEGSEHEIFEATSDQTLKRVGTIAIEYHPNEPKSPLFRCILDAGFRLVLDTETPRGSNGGVAFFINKKTIFHEI